MSEILLLSRVVAVLYIGHIVVNALHSIDSLRKVRASGGKWEISVEFTQIAAFLLAIIVLVKWAV